MRFRPASVAITRVTVDALSEVEQPRLQSRNRSRTRRALSVVLILLAAVTALVGGFTLYVREKVVDSSAFADSAVKAVNQPTVRKVLVRELTEQVIEPALPDVIAARPLVQSAVKSLLGSGAFAPIIRLAARHGHRLLFDPGGGNAVFDIADAGAVVAGALKNLAPRVGTDIPRQAEAVLMTVRKRGFAAETLRVADTVRLLGLVLPPLALLLITLSILADHNRRAGITRAGIAFGVTAIAMAIALELARRYVVSHAYVPATLTRGEARGAVDELWQVYMNGLLTWALGAAAVGALVTAAAAPVIAPYSGTHALQRLVAARPTSRRAGGVAGALALGAGLFLILAPGLATRIIAVIAGGVLSYVGAGEILRATEPVDGRVWRPRPIRAPGRALLGSATAVAIGVLVFAVFLTGSSSKVQASTIPACNGYPQLCSRRLNEVVFAGTHNSMSAADSPGWLIANQERTIYEQLRDGIRAFKISTHYGVRTRSGRVYTDIAAEGDRLNRVAAKLPLASREALQRFSRSVSGGHLSGTRDIWLCHTMCELGATRMVDFLLAIRRFIQANPDQVIVLFDEDYVEESDLQGAFERSGLFRYLATLQIGQPLPTLGDLVRSRRNVVVLAQKVPSGRYAWNADGFRWIQDTPLGARKPSQFTCKPNRGISINPMLMMNNWADVFPPRPSPNVPLVKRNFILERAAECERERGMLPNLILTDYYDRGDVVGAVAELNGVASEKAAPINPVKGSG